jgi:hypothetical protein
MPNQNSLVNLGDFGTAATEMVSKVSDAIEGLCLPWQMKRIAKAEVQAEKIKTIGRFEISEIERRALVRLCAEEARKQENMENIVQKALPGLKENARPREIENDWIVNFFDKCRLISDEVMQELWARVLSGEGNVPGSFSKRTINLMGSIDKGDAELFKNLCNYSWDIGRLTIPLVYEKEDEVYRNNGINFSSLLHLNSIGLINYDHDSSFVLKDLSQKALSVKYQDKSLNIQLPGNGNHKILTGHVQFTIVGEDLAKICVVKEIDGFFDYIRNQWKQQGIIIEENAAEAD